MLLVLLALSVLLYGQVQLRISADTIFVRALVLEPA